MKKKFQARQGDLLFVTAGKPKGKKVETPILAHGEVTGHAHSLVGDFTHYYDKEDDSHYVVGSSVVTHDEHGPIPLPLLPPNQSVNVIRQRQLDLATLTIKKVVD